MEHLKSIRKDKHVSQQTVASYLGTTRQAYCNYENGNRAPDFETLLKLAEYFGVTVDEILRGKEKAPVTKDECLMEELYAAIERLDSDDRANLLNYIRNVLLLAPKYDVKKEYCGA